MKTNEVVNVILKRRQKWISLTTVFKEYRKGRMQNREPEIKVLRVRCHEVG